MKASLPNRGTSSRRGEFIFTKTRYVGNYDITKIMSVCGLEEDTLCTERFRNVQLRFNTVGTILTTEGNYRMKVTRY